MTFHMRKVTGNGLSVLLLSGLVSGLFTFAGCKSESVDGRVPVAGTVTLDGAPINRGTIEFHPQESGGLQSGGMIIDGKFEISGEFGPKPGKYQVRLFAANEKEVDDTPVAPGDSSKTPLAKERIPAKFNTKSELIETIPEGGNKKLTFAVTSK